MDAIITPGAGSARAAPSENVIEVQGLTKLYEKTAAVDGISFAVGAGEIFGLLGPNGAGKTTTILMLLGLSDISAGTARVFGHDPMRDPLRVKRLVGYLPDSVGFYDNISAADNLHYTARLMGIPKAERERKIADALARVGLKDVADKKVGAFSRGMRQRLGLAEIVMKEARIAILDEPTNGLDPQASLELLDLIRSFKAHGMTVLLSSHLLERVQSVCDRVALFNAGRIALMGTVGDLGRQVLGGGFAVEVEAEGGDNLARRLSALSGVRAVTEPAPGRFRMMCDRDLRAEAAAEVVAGQGRLTQLSLDHPSLETIYTRYFQNQDDLREVPHAA
jgi:ABC-2 type transport system ATP-binding protein